MRRAAVRGSALLAWVLAHTWAVAAPATQPAVTVKVNLVTDARLPALSEAQVDAVLSRAAVLIVEAGGPAVKFDVPAKVDAGEYAAVVAKLRAPLPVPTEFSAEATAHFEAAALQRAADGICRMYASPTELLSLLGDPAGVEATYPAASAYLAGQYARRLNGLAELKVAGTGDRVIGGAGESLFHLSTWGVAAAMEPLDGPVTVSLYNGFTYEDYPGDAAPHSLATAQAFGLTNVYQRISVVSYHLILRDYLPREIDPVRFRAASIDERLSAIAYVVAHEVGNHALSHCRDDFAPRAGIARPLAALGSAAELRPTPSAPRLATDKRLDVEGLAFYSLSQRAEVLAARKDFDGLSEVLSRVADLKISEKPKAEFMRRMFGAMK